MSNRKQKFVADAVVAEELSQKKSLPFKGIKNYYHI
jgi:hypothetical protein